MKRIIRLTESDLARIVRRVINEEAGAGQIKIPNEARFTGELNGDQTPWLRLTAMVGGNANKYSTPGVVEFDARLKYINDYQGADAKNKAGKVFPIKAYFGCKTGLFTANNPSDGSIVKFTTSQGGSGVTELFKDWVLTNGLCPKGAYTSQEELRGAFRN